MVPFPAEMDTIGQADMSGPGSFCTSVLKTSDPDRAARFYTVLLGWTAKPASPDHTFLQFDGRTVASIQSIANGHDAWIPHVCVDALERTTEAATALGATLLNVTEVPGVARLATLRDRESGSLWTLATRSAWRCRADGRGGLNLVDRGVGSRSANHPGVLRTVVWRSIPFGAPSSRLMIAMQR